MSELSDLSSRFIEVYQYLKDSGKVSGQSDFANKIGISGSLMTEILRNRSNVGMKAIQNTVTKFPLINVDWIITGRGKMNEFYIPEIKYTESLGEEYGTKKSGIPLIPTEAFAGIGGGEVFIKEIDIQERYVIPDFENVDFMIRVSGSSMYPKYNSGDVVACKMIIESTFIQWNKVHVISTREQGVLIKRLRKSENENCLLAVSENEDYGPFDIPVNEIINIAIVVGVVRLE